MIYKTYTMENALEAIIDYRGKTPKKADTGIPALSAKSVKNNYIDYNACYYISPEEYKRFMVRGKPQKGDILLTTEAPMGMVACLDRDDVAIAQRLLTLRGKENILDNNYLLYYLQSPIGQALLRARETGTTVMGIKQSEFKKIQISIPGIEIQRKIGKFLRTIDKKIVVNESINRNLYDLCITIYSEMFEGKAWNEDFLENCTSQIIRGKSGDYVEYSKYVNLNQKVNKGFNLEKQYYKYLDESIEIPEEKFGRPKDIILNSLGQGTLGRVHFLFDVEPNVVIDQHISIIRTNERMTPEYLYFMLASTKYQDIINNSAAGSTGMLMLNISVVRGLKVEAPPIDIQEEFSRIVEPMYSLIEIHNLENEKLTNLREGLLPKLMSGELDVSNLNI